MSVLRPENKQLLSQILNDHPLKKNNPQGFIQLLDAQLNIIHQSRFRYNNDLTRMNKEIIRKFQEIVPSSNVIPSENPHNAIDRKRAGTPNDGEKEEVVPKIKIFETRLKEQQDHFNSLIKAEIPEEIDFSDKASAENSITTEALDETMQQRQDELQKIMSTYQKKDKKETEAWINGESVQPNSISISEISPTSIIKTANKREQKNRRVSFEVNEKNDSINENKDAANNFLNKLKIKHPHAEAILSKQDDDYSDYFIQIIKNQQLIITELVTLNSKVQKGDTAL